MKADYESYDWLTNGGHSSSAATGSVSHVFTDYDIDMQIERYHPPKLDHDLQNSNSPTDLISEMSEFEPN